MKKIILIMCSVLLIACLFIGCDDGAVKEIYSHTTSTDSSAMDTYTVTFDMQGHGTLIDPITDITSGSNVSAPTDPTETGYTFDGWYKEALCTNAWNFATDTVTTNITLYAKWTIVLTSVEVPTSVTGLIYNGTEQTGVAESTGYTVTNGKATGANSYTATATLAEGYKWSDNTTETKLVEWSIAKASLTATADDKNVNVGDAVPEYTVTYTGWVNSESISTVTPVTAAVLDCGYTVTSVAGDYDITFTTEPAFADYSVTVVNGTLTVYPKYTVTFDMQGHGTLIDPITDITSGSNVSAPTDPTETGYTFDGWYKEALCTNAWNFATDTVTTNITLYAKWNKDISTIADVLATVPGGFPTYTGHAHVWKNASGTCCYDSGGLRLQYMASGEPTSNNVTKSGDNYIYGNYTFVMTDGVLTSIVVSGYGGIFDGTYRPS